MEKMILSPLQLSSVAKSYYEGSIPKNTYGMEKYVATDGENAMFVKSDYQPAPGEVVFYIKRMRSELYCQLYRESYNTWRYGKKRNSPVYYRHAAKSQAW